jgi:hypothetical protein
MPMVASVAVGYCFDRSWPSEMCAVLSRGVRRGSRRRQLSSCPGSDPDWPTSWRRTSGAFMCAEASHRASQAIPVGDGWDPMRAVRLCALRHLTMVRKSSRGCRDDHTVRGIAVRVRGTAFARNGSVRDNRPIPGKPLPVPGSRVCQRPPGQRFLLDHSFRMVDSCRPPRSANQVVNLRKFLG